MWACGSAGLQSPSVPSLVMTAGVALVVLYVPEYGTQKYCIGMSEHSQRTMDREVSSVLRIQTAGWPTTTSMKNYTQAYIRCVLLLLHTDHITISRNSKIVASTVLLPIAVSRWLLAARPSNLSGCLVHMHTSRTLHRGCWLSSTGLGTLLSLCLLPCNVANVYALPSRRQGRQCGRGCV